MPEAEPELVAGFHTEYSSMSLAMFFSGSTSAVSVSAVATVLFLGGWHGPFLPESLLDLVSAETVAMVFFFIWMRWTLPR